MRETHPQSSSASPKDTLPPIQTPTIDEDKQGTPSHQEAKQLRVELPVLRAEALITGSAITDSSSGLYSGVYEGQAVTIQQVPSSVFVEHRALLGNFVHSASPFWLPVTGVCEGTNTSDWVMHALPETRFDAWLASSASESWINRCRLVRDVAVGLYQRRSIGATSIHWNPQQLYLDKDGRAQLIPLLSETPTTEADEVYALGQLIWQVASRKTELIDGWQQGKGLPRDCPPAVIKLIQDCTNSTVSARPSLKALAKGLDAFWQRAEKGLADALPQVTLCKRTQIRCA